ncbi:MAG: ComEC/Rec2 family competence protein, partial [Gemmatimonadota bacterium]|nr:ComEC/Rec2 family competence protein [Gemmatimonadota bacterium]
MPLIALAVLTYAAGLVAGFLAAPLIAILCGTAYAAFAAVRRSGTHAALGALVAAGASVALWSAAHDARCRAEGPHRSRWSAQLEDAAAPGAYVRASVYWPGCAMPASMSVERGRAAAGARVSIEGTVFVTARGLKLAHARIAPEGPRAPLLAARAAIGARIDTLFRADAPLVRALLIADERAVDPAVRDRFAVSGIVHMLSISGLHVAIIAMAVELLCRMARLRPAAASLATLAITAAYVAVIGLPAPAVRSGVMLGVRSICKLVQRPTSPWAALALGAA